jgi:galactose oxidase-like protein
MGRTSRTLLGSAIYTASDANGGETCQPGNSRRPPAYLGSRGRSKRSSGGSHLGRSAVLVAVVMSLLTVLQMTSLGSGAPAGWAGSTGSSVPIRAIGAYPAATLVSRAQQSLLDGSGPARGSVWMCSTQAQGAVCGPQLGQVRPAAPSVGWNQLGSTPPLGGVAHLAFDGSSNAAILLTPVALGAYNTLVYETWTYSSGVWTQLNVTTSPPACDGAELAYDLAESEAVYWGGGNCSSSGETWVFTGGIWLHLNPPSHPVERDYSSLAYDPALNETILFGGLNATCPSWFCSDTWAFANNNWTDLTKSLVGAPSGRAYAGLTYDPNAQDLVLFGGINGTYVALGDTWLFNGTAWAKVATTTLPPASAPPLLVDDAGDGFVFLATSNSDWKFNGTDWLNVTPSGALPPTERWAGVTYDSADNCVLVFEGQPVYSATPPTGLTWTFHSSVWANRTSPPPPPARMEASMVYDGSDGYVLLFGGYSFSPGSNGNILGDTWTFRGGNWTDLTATLKSTPSPRAGAAIAYDARDGYVVLFGGESISCKGGPNPSFPVCGDTWEFVNGSWALLHPAQAPSNRSNAGFIFDTALDEMILAGGSNEYGLNDTWAFRAGTWSNLTSDLAGSHPTAPFAQLSFTYDAFLGVAILFGGYVASAPYSPNQTWEFNGTAWLNVTKPAGSTAPSEVAGSLAYDPTYGFDVFFGGCADPYCTTNSANTYLFNHSTWTQAHPSASPPARDWASITYDAADGYVLLFGGRNVSNVFGDGWTFGLAGPPVLAVSSFSASPTVTDVGRPIMFSVAVVGALGALSYRYVNLPPGCSSANLSALTCVPMGTGTFTVAAVVTGGNGAYASARVTVAVNADPTIDSFVASPPAVNVGVRTVLSTTAGLGTPPYLFFYSGLPPGCTSQTVPVLPCVPSQNGTFTVEVTLTDVVSLSVNATLQLSVTPGGLPGSPLVSEFLALPNDIVLGNTTNFSVNASEGTLPLSYSYSGLPNGCLSSNLSEFSCQPTQAGAYVITVTVSDPEGRQTDANLSLNVEPAGGAGRPSVVGFAAEPPRIVLGNGTNLTVTLGNVEGSVTFVYGGLPLGCDSTSAPQLTCVPRTSGNYTVRVTVIDQSGNRTSVPTPLTVDPNGSVIKKPPPTQKTGLPSLQIVVLTAPLALLGLAGGLWAMFRYQRRRWRNEGREWIRKLRMDDPDRGPRQS